MLPNYIFISFTYDYLLLAVISLFSSVRFTYRFYRPIEFIRFTWALQFCTNDNIDVIFQYSSLLYRVYINIFLIKALSHTLIDIVFFLYVKSYVNRPFRTLNMDILHFHVSYEKKTTKHYRTCKIFSSLIPSYNHGRNEFPNSVIYT